MTTTETSNFTPSALAELGPRYEEAKSTRDAYLNALLRIFEALETGETMPIVTSIHAAAEVVGTKLPGLPDQVAPKMAVFAKTEYARTLRAPEPSSNSTTEHEPK